MRRPKPALLALLLSASIFVLAACVGDLNPDGGWAAPVVTDDYVYLGAKDGRITRLDLGEGGRFDGTWGFPIAGADTLGPLYGTPRIDGDRIFGATYDCSGLDCEARVYAISAADASALWPESLFTLNTSVVGAVAVAGDTVLIGTSAIDDELDPSDAEGYLYALDADPDASSRVLWRFPTDAAVWGSPVISEGVVYFGDLDGILHAVSLGGESGDPGVELWNFQAGGAIVAQPFISDGKIYFGDFSDAFYSLDIASRQSGARTGDPGPGEWKFESDGWFWASPVLHGGTLYVGTLNGKVYALDPDTGGQLWPEPGEVDGQIVGHAAVIEDGNQGLALAVPSGKDNIGVFALANGDERNGFPTESGVKAGLIADDGFLYAHTTDDKLIKFNVADRRVITCIEAETGAAC